MKKRIFAIALAAITAVGAIPVLAYTYKDVIQGEWYEQAVTNATTKGWFSGYEDGTFRPENSVTRAELAAILTRMEKGTTADSATKKGDDTMTQREQQAQSVYTRLMEGADVPENISESELYDIVNKVLFGDVYNDGTLEENEREMICLAVLTANGTTTLLKSHIYAALNTGMSTAEITETIYQCTPYVGSAKSLEAIGAVNEIFAEKGLAMPESQSSTTDDTRWEKGKEVQASIFGHSTGSEYSGTKIATNYLPDFCFGDFYTRGTLDVKQREIITFCCLAAMGGCDSQIRSHITANNNVGNDREHLMNVVTTCMPYIGFPRSLNAISAINEILPADVQ